MRTLKKTTDIITAAVKNIAKVHPEGEKFFDKLDEFLSTGLSNDVYAELIGMADGKTLVMSGSFGKKIADLIDSGVLKGEYMLFKGGLRGDNMPELIRKNAEPKRTSVFIDDTIYGGLTYRKIKEFLKDSTNLYKCVVLYDGCPVKKDDVESMFRYYDHFSAKPNFNF